MIIDDHPAIRFGISLLINAHSDLTVCGEASDSPSALKALSLTRADAVLLDIGLPGENGIELMPRLRKIQPFLPILLVSTHHESQFALQAFKLGASGYIMKADAAASVVEGLRAILLGEMFFSASVQNRPVFRFLQNGTDLDISLNKLSRREKEVFAGISLGRGTRQIAKELRISPKTVETHRIHIKEKFRIATAEELKNFAQDWQLAKH